MTSHNMCSWGSRGWGCYCCPLSGWRGLSRGRGHWSCSWPAGQENGQVLSLIQTQGRIEEFPWGVTHIGEQILPISLVSALQSVPFVNRGRPSEGDGGLQKPVMESGRLNVSSARLSWGCGRTPGAQSGWESGSSSDQREVWGPWAGGQGVPGLQAEHSPGRSLPCTPGDQRTEWVWPVTLSPCPIVTSRAEVSGQGEDTGLVTHWTLRCQCDHVPGSSTGAWCVLLTHLFITPGLLLWTELRPPTSPLLICMLKP